jgi:hypothetical protein
MHRAVAFRSKRIGSASNNRRGLMAVLLLFSLVVLLGMGALALNRAWLTSHQVLLRQACEAAAIAAAEQLHDPTPGDTSAAAQTAAQARATAAMTQAKKFFALNSSAVIQTTTGNSDLVARWCLDPIDPGATSTAWTGAGSVNSLAVRGVRRVSFSQAVTVWFGGFFGVSRAEPAATAQATMDQRIYGFHPWGDDVVAVPMVALLVPSTITWPPAATGASIAFSDAYTVDSRTGAVTTGADGIGEITLHVAMNDGSPPSQGDCGWISLPTSTTNFPWLAAQIESGLEAVDLAGIGGSFALAADGTLSLPLTSAPSNAQNELLRTALLNIRGQKRVWPIGAYAATQSQNATTSCTVTGFVAGCVVDCVPTAGGLDIVVQACTIQTCTGLLRNGMAENPWIGKVILNE